MANTKSNTINLKKCTPKSMQVLQELGLVGKDLQEHTAKVIEVTLDTEKIEKLATTIFDEHFEGTDWDEFDLTKLTGGLQLFLQRLLQPLRR